MKITDYSLPDFNELNIFVESNFSAVLKWNKSGLETNHFLNEEFETLACLLLQAIVLTFINLRLVDRQIAPETLCLTMGQAKLTLDTSFCIYGCNDHPTPLVHHPSFLDSQANASFINHWLLFLTMASLINTIFFFPSNLKHIKTLA